MHYTGLHTLHASRMKDRVQHPLDASSVPWQESLPLGGGPDIIALNPGNVLA